MAFALGGCNCGTDPGNGDGGNVDPDSGNGDGDGGDGDGGGNGNPDGGGNGNPDGGGGSACLTIDQACAGKCGFVDDNCEGGFQCDSLAGVGAGGVDCGISEICTNNACIPGTQMDGGMPVTCPPETMNQASRCAAFADDRNCGRWTEPTTGCIVDCWIGIANQTCPVAGNICAQAGGAGSWDCRAPATGGGCEDGTPPANTVNHCTAGDVPTAATCSGNANATTLTGTVKTPGRGGFNQVPVPNAIVYIPAVNARNNSSVDTGIIPDIATGITPGDNASCGRCADEKFTTGTPPITVLASAITNARGEFTLTGQIPTGAFSLVVKSGKWRRVIDVPAATVTQCVANNLPALGSDPAGVALLPSVGTADGLNHIPHIAVSTGNVDNMESVLWRLGFAQAQFTQPSVATTETAGRIHMYYGNGGVPPTPGAGNCAGAAGCASTALYGTTGAPGTNRLNQYDMIVMDCEGGETQHDEQEPNIVAYVDNGGRMFASHFSYTWIQDNGTLDASADWFSPGSLDTGVGRISLPAGGTPTNSTQRAGANPVKSLVFREFLDWMGALDTTETPAFTDTASAINNPDPPRFDLADPRDQAGANVGPSTDEWVYRNVKVCSNNGRRLCQVNGDCQNGGTCNNSSPRVCSNNSGRYCTQNSECQNGGTCNAAAPLVRVQQLSFNTPYGAGAATQCGRVAYSGFHVSDANLDSGDTFPYGQTDRALTSQELVLAYMLFDLNSCVSTGTVTPPTTCTPIARGAVCTSASVCGNFSDGCGGIITCDPCNNGGFCSGNVCQPNSCVPITMCSQVAGSPQCGTYSDGCSGSVSCPACPGGQNCINGMCTSMCTPTADPCGSVGANCGTVDNGCGVQVSCGDCPEGIQCSIDGVCILEP